MKTFFINQNDHYFVINEHVDDKQAKRKSIQQPRTLFSIFKAAIKARERRNKGQ
ncbi:hypothetical protein [Vibrio owensii]|uniref:hypothetical protein n=1 Tax=Vibrio owensii TaxID=696485 RepID=UPI0038CDE4F2